MYRQQQRTSCTWHATGPADAKSELHGQLAYRSKYDKYKCLEPEEDVTYAAMHDRAELHGQFAYRSNYDKYKCLEPEEDVTYAAMHDRAHANTLAANDMMSVLPIYRSNGDVAEKKAHATITCAQAYMQDTWL